jgi:hypothetical protein
MHQSRPEAWLARRAVEIQVVDPANSPVQHKWLKWLGLQEPPLEADSWMPSGTRVAHR